MNNSHLRLLFAPFAALAASACAPAFSNLGAALLMTGDLQGAARALEKSLALEPTRSAYSNSGTVYYFLGRFAEAAQMFRKAASRIGDADHVNAYAQRARQAGPDIVYVHYYGALIAIQQHDAAAAVGELQRALHLGSGATRARCSRLRLAAPR